MNNATTEMAAQMTYTHDRRPVYPVGAELPPWAHGWVQCNNQGGAYSTWLAADDQPRAKADSIAIAAEAKKLRTHKACEAALLELGVRASGTCADIRLQYQITKYADLWPLRQVAR